MLTDNQIIAKYGQPGDESNFVLLQLPYPMYYVASPTKKTEITRLRCHKLIAEPLRKVFMELMDTYGVTKLNELRISHTGGCVAVRLQRGSKTKWSRHSWGIAIDLDPLRNTLKETSKTARFARPEYKPMIDIFYKHGFISYGVERNNDYMHFEIGS